MMDTATSSRSINPLNAELNRTCQLLVLLGAHHILHVSRIRVNSEATEMMEVYKIWRDFRNKTFHESDAEEEEAD
jgi:hypothetical protein